MISFGFDFLQKTLEFSLELALHPTPDAVNFQGHFLPLQSGLRGFSCRDAFKFSEFFLITLKKSICIIPSKKLEEKYYLDLNRWS